MSAHTFHYSNPACGCRTGFYCSEHQPKPSRVEPLPGELELLARQLHNVIERHRPISCGGCFGTFLMASKRLKELEVVPE